MPKLYQDGDIPPYKTKEYYKIKMREYRKQNPTSQKNTLWYITINGKKHIFKSKQDINITKIKKQDIDHNQDVLCF